MPEPFAAYVAGFEDLLSSGHGLHASVARAPKLPALTRDAPVCLMFSPHPDDEAISGALPWRLRAQSGWRVVNIAVTLGSNTQRRDARWSELCACCAFLGFDPVSASGETHHGLERISRMTQQTDRPHWGNCVARVAALIALYRPRLIVFPHADDGHAVHIGTHLLVKDALLRLGPDLQVYLALSEYWNTQSDPGLMVELGNSDVAALIGALSQHVGEVRRNPYHLSLPAWFIDSVRRGAERVRPPGSPAPEFRFASLYGWERWTGAIGQPMGGQLLPVGASLADLFVR